MQRGQQWWCAHVTQLSQHHPPPSLPQDEWIWYWLMLQLWQGRTKMTKAGDKYIESEAEKATTGQQHSCKGLQCPLPAGYTHCLPCASTARHFHAVSQVSLQGNSFLRQFWASPEACSTWQLHRYHWHQWPREDRLTPPNSSAEVV